MNNTKNAYKEFMNGHLFVTFNLYVYIYIKCVRESVRCLPFRR